MAREANWDGFEFIKGFMDENPRLSAESCIEGLSKIINEENCGRLLLKSNDFFLYRALLDKNVKFIFERTSNTKYKKEVEYINDDILLITLTNEINKKDRIEYTILFRNKRAIIYPIENNEVSTRHYVEIYL